uniref:Uncharacterized protein n=1 Tax=Vespula pensylvanica TaxID=30213 RepID=A0A834P8N7_VESPE|nr:hypothetical protein H0235_004604 [Vespula pensylvanica]
MTYSRDPLAAQLLQICSWTLFKGVEVRGLVRMREGRGESKGLEESLTAGAKQTCFVEIGLRETLGGNDMLPSSFQAASEQQDLANGDVSRTTGLRRALCIPRLSFRRVVDVACAYVPL